MQNIERDPHRGLCLLSLDGGPGVSGFSILLIIKAILQYVQEEENKERRARKEPLVKQLRKPCELFHLIGGTNTGGIIALLLGRLGMSIDAAIGIFRDIMEKVFASGISDPARRTSILQDNIKQLLLARTGKPDELLIKDDLDCQVFVCSRSEGNMNAGIPVLFRTYYSPLVEHDSEDCTIWQAACATSSTPELFSPIVIGRDQTYVDGRLGCSNPTKRVLDEAETLCPGRKVALILSVGTGHLQTISLASSSMDQVFSQIAGDYLYLRLSVEQGMQNVDYAQAPEAVLAIVETHTNIYLRTAGTIARLKRAAANIHSATGKLPIDILTNVPSAAAQTAAPTPTIPPSRTAPSFVSRFDDIEARNLAYLHQEQFRTGPGCCSDPNCRWNVNFYEQRGSNRRFPGPPTPPRLMASYYTPPSHEMHHDGHTGHIAYPSGPSRDHSTSSNSSVAKASSGFLGRSVAEASANGSNSTSRAEANSGAGRLLDKVLSRWG